MTLDLLTTGYASIDYIYNVSRSPLEDETAILETFSSSGTHGGCGLNVAAALAKLGFDVGTAVVLGDDPEGLEYAQTLNSMGVRMENIIHLPGSVTSRTYVFLNPAGRYQLFFLPGAAGDWKPPLGLTGLEQTRACLLTVGAAHYNQEFVNQVIEAGVPLFWQLKSDVQAYPPEQLGRLMRTSRLMFMNDAECQYLLNVMGAVSLEDLLEENQTAILTHGIHGSDVLARTGMVHVPSVPPVLFKDSTGAGDGFTAGYLAGYFKGFSPQTCASLGAVLASFVIEAVGCQTNLPDWAQLSERYQTFFHKSFE
jgi:adenosine kinase